MPEHSCRGRVAALGFFDGVHRGHQAILQKAAGLAAEKGLESAAVTFENHPRGYVLGRAPELIVPFSRRYALLQQAGAQLVVALTFDQQMAETAPEEFAAMLRERYRVETVVCGENYRFGSRAAGTPELLRQLGFETHVVPPVLYGQKPVSSTWIRECVREGKVGLARRLLGRPFQLEGPVSHGFQVGRKLGFPTVNVMPEAGMLLPRRGVYVTEVALEQGVWRAVTNVGSRPTFTDADIVSVESYLLDFSGDLYDKAVQVRFLKYLRPEKSFANGDALREQISRDVQSALAWRG